MTDCNLITTRPANATPPRPVTTLDTVETTIARHVAELAALAGSPGERAILARIATQAIERGLAGGAA